MKKVQLFITTAILSTVMGMTALAGEWKQNTIGWWYQNDGGSYPTNQWKWLDGNNDGISECYYFDSNGYMLFNTTTPDGYTVNSNGSWVVDGIIQTQILPNDSNKSTETGFIKQEYLDMLGKNRDYVINYLGNTENKSTSTFDSNVYEQLFYTEEDNDIMVSLKNNKVTEISYIRMYSYDSAQEQQIMKKIDSQFGVKSQKTDYNGSVWYTWKTSTNPSIELTYYTGGSYTLTTDTY